MAKTFSETVIPTALLKVCKNNYKIINQECIWFPPSKRVTRIGGTKYFLPFPYTVFAKIKLKSMQYKSVLDLFCVFFANQEPTKPGVPLFLPPLPNITEYGTVCLGKDNIDSLSLIECISLFWSTEFAGTGQTFWLPYIFLNKDNSLSANQQMRIWLKTWENIDDISKLCREQIGVTE